MIKGKTTCYNIYYVWYGPSIGAKPECMKFGKPCKQVKKAECPYKAGTQTID